MESVFRVNLNIYVNADAESYLLSTQNTERVHLDGAFAWAKRAYSKKYVSMFIYFDFWLLFTVFSKLILF